MSAKENIEVMRGIFNAIERRDLQGVTDRCHPDVEFLWPPSLPYDRGERGGWAQTWIPLQPTEAEQRMDARVVAASEEEVVVLWRQRGVSPAGEKFDDPVLGLYRLRDGKLARAQMFYFDTVPLVRFLANAKGAATAGTSL
jgi:ketosteroid isomerase-like protein